MLYSSDEHIAGLAKRHGYGCHCSQVQKMAVEKRLVFYDDTVCRTLKSCGLRRDTILEDSPDTELRCEPAFTSEQVPVLEAAFSCLVSFGRGATAELKPCPTTDRQVVLITVETTACSSGSSLSPLRGHLHYPHGFVDRQSYCPALSEVSSGSCCNSRKRGACRCGQEQRVWAFCICRGRESMCQMTFRTLCLL